MNRIALQQCLRARVVPRLPRTTTFFQRSFATTESSTSERRNVAFDDDLSPKLKEILTEAQNKIILPSYINTVQRKRIFDPKQAASLKNNPVFIEIDDIYHRFDATPIATIPRTKKTLRTAVAAMETPRDFQQFNRLLSGFNHAGESLNPEILAALCRMMAAKGQLGVLLEAARQVKRTGLQVGSPAVLHTLLTWTQVKALDAGWARAETEQALKWTRHILEMSALEPHKFSVKRMPPLPFPLHRDPIALTAPLHLAAALAVGHEGGRDFDKQVTLYARQLVNAWPANKGYADLYPAQNVEAKARFGGFQHLSSPSAMHSSLSLALHGMRLASKVVDKELAGQLDAIAARLQTDIAANTALLPRGLEEGSMHKKLNDSLFDASGAVKLDVTPTPAAAPAAKEAEAEKAE
ncbi:hypothetical protein F5X68DRAFT_231818 [Plectosphaerella plurivora]|uniref:Uncharacterized protein n=1 Tax=Plectosphaerella plurivora TaxID=936078 RepID=A0A9P8VDE8_9PEZI|nr:hypothetical protein F5X68DRAFT_231818 [Plectosphaerella plurivora]